MAKRYGDFRVHDIAVLGNAEAAIHGPGVYVIGFDGYVKIGMSARLSSRILTLQELLPNRIEVHAILTGGRTLETELHDRFQRYRTRGEWFRNEGALKAWIEAKCKMPFYALHAVNGGRANNPSDMPYNSREMRQ